MLNTLPLTRPIAILCATALFAGSALAQSSTRGGSYEASALLQDDGSAERIQLSGSLRMLSQRISATACNRAAGGNVADAEEYLASSIRDYRRILAGLENGDDGLGLHGPESNRLILRDIAKLNALWAPLDGTFKAVAPEALTKDHVALIAQTVPELLDVSKQLLGFIVAEYSDPTQMLQSDAVLLQIAERQRLIEQEIANATCLIANGMQIEESREVLKEAIPQYDVSLGALRNGMPEAGVAPPPTQEIDLWLEDVAVRWGDVRPTLEQIAAGGDVSDEDRQKIFEVMNKLTWMMDVTVGQYTAASKLTY